MQQGAYGPFIYTTTLTLVDIFRLLLIIIWDVSVNMWHMSN